MSAMRFFYFFSCVFWGVVAIQFGVCVCFYLFVIGWKQSGNGGVGVLCVVFGVWVSVLLLC